MGADGDSIDGGIERLPVSQIHFRFFGISTVNNEWWDFTKCASKAGVGGAVAAAAVRVFKQEERNVVFAHQSTIFTGLGV